MNIHSGIFLTVLLVATLTARAETAIHDNPGKPSGTNASETAAIIALEHRDAKLPKSMMSRPWFRYGLKTECCYNHDRSPS